MGVKEIGSRKYGMMTGVFIPTFLTIVGVILFLRLGYIVGNIGPWKTSLIVFLASSVSISTGLSLSSIITNIRVGSGGAYSIISKTLGLEVGGSVGIPLYLAQIFSIALYIFGFTEVWLFIFPMHARILVIFITFIVLILLTIISTNIAMRTQILVFLIIILSLLAIIFSGFGTFSLQNMQSFQGNGDFWFFFALFFPAITGLMAGIGMSGELSDPKRQIPKGILLALFITTGIYLLMIFYFAINFTQFELITNNLIIVRQGFFSPFILLGILAATFSSALTTLVAAPRLLQALGENKVIPLNTFLSKKNSRSEPFHALTFSALLICLLLLVGNLNSIAPFLTIFFLISYAMINLSVFVEQSLSLVSFRPLFSIPKFVPLYGLVSSVVIMFYINPLVGFLSIGFLISIYVILSKRRLRVRSGDVRSGLFKAITEWSVKKASYFPEGNKHVWEPNICLPVRDSDDLERCLPVVKGILHKTGTLSVIGMQQGKKRLAAMEEKVESLKHEDIFTVFSILKTSHFFRGLSVALQTIRGQLFHPNSVILRCKDFTRREIKKLFEISQASKLGLIFYKKEVQEHRKITVWVPEHAIDKDFFDDSDFDLSMLLGYQLAKHWRGKIIIRMRVGHHKRALAKRFLYKLMYESRIQKRTRIVIESSSVDVSKIRGLQIVPVKNDTEFFKMFKEFREVEHVLFVKDSQTEDVLA